jgi:hypothetical protein
MGRGGINGIDYGKIKVFSSESSLDDIYAKFEQIMNKYNYPESDDGTAGDERLKNLQSDADLMESDSEDELSEADATDLDEIDELDDEDEEVESDVEASSPWVRAKRSMEDKNDTGKETPK